MKYIFLFFILLFQQIPLIHALPTTPKELRSNQTEIQHENKENSDLWEESYIRANGIASCIMLPYMLCMLVICLYGQLNGIPCEGLPK